MKLKNVGEKDRLPGMLDGVVLHYDIFCMKEPDCTMMLMSKLFGGLVPVDDTKPPQKRMCWAGGRTEQVLPLH